MNGKQPRRMLLVEDDRGFRLWGNLPSAIYRAEKGDRVTFVAALTASRRSH